MRNWQQTAEHVRQEVSHLCRAIKIAWEILKILSSSYIPKAMDLAITSWLDKLIATPWVIVMLYDLSWLLAISLVIGFSYTWIDQFRPSTKFKALAPHLEHILQDRITYADLEWMKAELEHIRIASPPGYGTIDVMPIDTIMAGPVRTKWNHFLMQLVPLAHRGKVRQARKLSTSLTELDAGPL